MLQQVKIACILWGSTMIWQFNIQYNLSMSHPPAVFCFLMAGGAEVGPCNPAVTTTCEVGTVMTCEAGAGVTATAVFLVVFLGESDESGTRLSS